MTNKEMKRLAKDRMRTTKPHVLLIALIFCIISYTLSSISQGILMGPVLEEMMADPEILMDKIANGYTPVQEWSFLGSLLTLAVDVVSIIMSFGFSIYVLNVSRGYPAGVGTLFDGFAFFIKVIWLNIRMSVVILLWSLLLIVPGMIAAYSYRQSFYLLMDHPDWSAKKCMRESRRIMQGHKAELLRLDLSFIGWFFLTIVPLVSIYVLPYTELTYATYYNKVSEWEPESPETALPEKSPWEY